MKYPDKYQLTQEESIFLVKKTLVENIYNQAKMENINITFPDTQTILEGVSVSGLAIDDIQKVLNLRNAWKFVLDDVQADFNLNYVKKIHQIVAYGEVPANMLGTIRTGDVSIGGSFYTPKIPDSIAIQSMIEDNFSNEKSKTEQALDYFLSACRGQFFWDGNKRTASICMNKVMIEAGVGVMTIPDKQLRRFNKLMIAFYKTADRSKIKQFLYDHCIMGINY